MSEVAWVSIIKLGVWLISIEGSVVIAYWRYINAQEKKYKEQSVGAEALRKQNEKIDGLKDQIQELKDENRRNWATFYEIQSKK